MTILGSHSEAFDGIVDRHLGLCKIDRASGPFQEWTFFASFGPVLFVLSLRALRALVWPL